MAKIKQPTNSIYLVSQPLDRERTRIGVLKGEEWNTSIFRLVGSYVTQEMTDAEITSLTQPLTLPGHIVEQTAAEVQDIITRTRKKFEQPHPLTKEDLSLLSDMPFQFWKDTGLTAIPSPQFFLFTFPCRWLNQLDSRAAESWEKYARTG